MLVPKSRSKYSHMTAALPSPHQLGEAHSGLCPGCGGQEDAHLPKGLRSKVQGSHTLLHFCTHPWGGCAVGATTGAWPRPHGTKLLPQPPPLPFPAFLIFFSIKISLCCSSIKAWRINIWSRGRETPGLKAPHYPHPSSLNPGLLSKEWFSVNLSYQQKPLKEFV